MTDKKTIAIVIGIGNYNDIGMIRGCGEAGLLVYYLAPQSMVVPVFKSRYVKKWIPTDVDSENEIAANLNSLAKEIPSDLKAVLFPTGDKIAIFLDRLKSSLPKNFIVPSSSKYDLEYLMDKSVMTDLAAQSNLNPPKSIVINLDESENQQLSFPLIVKPLASALGEKGDIAICRDMSDWEKAIARFRKHDTNRLLVQDLISGNNQHEFAVTGVALPDGNVLIEGYIDKIRTHGNGSTIFATYIPHVDNDLKERVKDFIALTSYHGIFDIEFMRNDDGDHFIECNFRNGAYGYAVTKGGFNMPAAFAYGTPDWRKRPKKMRKVVFMEERTDMLNMLDGTMTKSEWLKDFLRTNCLLWWNWRDLKPFIYHNMRWLRRK